MNRIIGPLLLILALTYAYPYWVEFRDWVSRRMRVVKRCRLRREAIRTNLRLYRQTGDEYYIERVKELERKAE